MKSAIYILYFSPTGSCRKIAEALAGALENAAVTMMDITLPHSRHNCFIPPDCHCLIAVLPVHAQDLPDCVAEFLCRLKGSATPAIIISIYGNIHRGRGLYRAAKLMSANNYKILAGVTCPAAHAYNNESLSVAASYPDKKTIMQITDFVKTSLKQLQAEGCSYLSPSALRAKKNIFAYLPQKMLSHLTVKKPGRENSLCTRCHRCRAACPVSAIDASLEIKNKLCIRCCACVKTCKQRARRIVFISPIPYIYLRSCGKKKEELRFYQASLQA